MKNLFIKLGMNAAVTATMLLLVFAPFTSLIAQAEDASVFDTGSGSAITNTGPTIATTPTNNTSGPSTITTANTVTNPSSLTTPANTAAQQLTQQQTSNDIFAGCKQFTVSTCVTSILYAFTVGIGSVFAYIAVYFFDVTIQLSLNGSAYGLDFISTSWTTARDLANMAFLFILLWIAFQIIFRADTHGTQSLLASVIIVALLVNFSFFFTRLVIDAGNILSVQFYNAIPVQSLATSVNGTAAANLPAGATSAVNSATSYLGAGTTKDLTAGIFNMLQIQNILNTNSLTAVNSANGPNNSGGGSTIATIFLFIAMGIIFWLLTVAFVTNGVKFLFRVVVLWFLIIVSPLAFIAAAVQGLDKGYFKQWREMLVAEAFYPVAFLFILLILNNFAVTLSGGGAGGIVGPVFNSLPPNTGLSSLSSWPAIGAALVSVAVRLGLVIGVLFVAMQASNKISTVGSQYADKAGSWAGGKLFGTYGALGRNTIGLGAYKLSQSERLQTAAANNSFARTLWRGANKLGGASFDARAPLKAAGIKDVGTAQKGGYKGSVDARVKMREEEAKKFNSLSDEQKAAARSSIEKEYAGEVASATAQKNAANKTASEAQDRLKVARETKDEAEQDVKDLQEKNAPQAEINAAIDKRRIAIADHKKVEKEAAGHTQRAQEFSTALSKIEEQKKKAIKEEEKNITPKNIYADSLAGKNGKVGNLSRLGMWIPHGDKKAAAKIRKGQSEGEKIVEAVKKLQEEEHKQSEEIKEKVEKAAEKTEKNDDHH